MAIQYNVNLIGSLSNTNGVLSDFSTSNYATFSGDIFNDTNVEIVFKTKFNRVTGDDQMCYTFYDSTKTYSLCIIGLAGGKFYFEITNGSASLGDISGTTTVTINTGYYIKAVRNNTTYTLYSSTNGTNWTTEGTLSNITFPSYTSVTNYIGGYAYDDNGFAIDQILDGTIDLNESYIKVGGQYVWRGVQEITRIQLRHDTAANWASVNPVLLEGEVGIETDTLKQKVGDGSTAWNSLAYAVNMSAKQDTLVSGTNIKTVNNTSLLGSGNIDTNEVKIVNQATSFSDLQTLFNQNKILIYYSYNANQPVYNYLSYFDSNKFVFTSVDNNIVYTITCDTSGWSPTTKNLADTSLSNLSSTGKTVIDGQWTNNTATNIVNGSNITWTSGHNYDLSSYLPNDGHVYEVIFTASWNGSTTGSNHELRASTDIITSAWNSLGRISGQNATGGTCILPVGSGRYVKLTTAAKACNSVYFSALGYRRLGTNS